MITSFRDQSTEDIFNGGSGSKKWQSIKRIARRKLLLLDAAMTLNDLKAPPNNKLEALKKDRKGQHSIRINDQYRVCFVWNAAGCTGVEITDYH